MSLIEGLGEVEPSIFILSLDEVGLDILLLILE
jgi:hypothetical protein